MIQKINSTTFKGSLLLKASEGSRDGLLQLQVFDTDDIKDISEAYLNGANYSEIEKAVYELCGDHHRTGGHNDHVCA